MKGLERLGLGTVQWGLPYGIANQHGTTPPATVALILSEARSRGVCVLDTGALYGDAESVLGGNDLEGFHVVSKTPRFATSSIRDEQARALVQVFEQSLRRLSCGKLYGLLVHHANDLLVPGGRKLWDAMSDLKEQGRVDKVGVSVYDGEQIDGVLKLFKPDIVQLPLSVLDQRMLRSGHLERLSDLGVEVHTRSAFLQGLLLTPPEKVPEYFEPIRPLLLRWRSAAQEQDLTPVQAALSFVRDIPWVGKVLVGVENLEHFRNCIEDFTAGTGFDASGLACDTPEFINPTLWKT